MILIDPYDLGDRWKELWRAALEHGSSVTVLAYLYNKAPRSASLLRRYQDGRAWLESRLKTEGAGRRLLIGRVPADALLPRAFHEVLLLGSAELSRALTPLLGPTSRALASRLARASAFEAP